jgi:hypothetical protein
LSAALLWNWTRIVFFTAEHCKWQKHTFSELNYTTTPGLPDFIGLSIPKRGKYTKWPQTKPNGSKILLTVIKYTNIFHSKYLQNKPNWDFSYENKPSGNPVHTTLLQQVLISQRHQFSPEISSNGKNDDWNCHTNLASTKSEYNKNISFSICSYAGLPDFSWYNIPKQGKIYQITTKLPNGHYIYQRQYDIPNGH